MANAKQRNKNRATAEKLRSNASLMASLKHTCTNCGEPGLHWLQWPQTIVDIVEDREPAGFWTCDKMYGTDGRRLDTTDKPLFL